MYLCGHKDTTIKRVFVVMFITVITKLNEYDGDGAVTAHEWLTRQDQIDDTKTFWDSIQGLKKAIKVMHRENTFSDLGHLFIILQLLYDGGAYKKVLTLKTYRITLKLSQSFLKIAI